MHKAVVIFFIALFAVLAWGVSLGRSQSEIRGRASVIDGDTIEVTGKRVRLWGIDAPESSQTCQDGSGAAYRCGREATFALDSHLAGNVVSCVQKDIDRYKRIVAVCRVGRTDINGWMVSQGWAVAYYSNKTYKEREAIARVGRLGVHQGQYVPPWDWRKGVR